MLRSPNIGSASHQYSSTPLPVETDAGHLLYVFDNTDRRWPFAVLVPVGYNSCAAVAHLDGDPEDVRDTCRRKDVDINLGVADVAAAVG